MWFHESGLQEQLHASSHPLRQQICVQNIYVFRTMWSHYSGHSKYFLLEKKTTKITPETNLLLISALIGNSPFSSMSKHKRWNHRNYFQLISANKFNNTNLMFGHWREIVDIRVYKIFAFFILIWRNSTFLEPTYHPFFLVDVYISRRETITESVTHSVGRNDVPNCIALRLALCLKF